MIILAYKAILRAHICKRIKIPKANIQVVYMDCNNCGMGWFWDEYNLIPSFDVPLDPIINARLIECKSVIKSDDIDKFVKSEEGYYNLLHASVYEIKDDYCILSFGGCKIFSEMQLFYSLGLSDVSNGDCFIFNESKILIEKIRWIRTLNDCPPIVC